MDIIVTGSIAYDYLMRFPGRFTDHLIKESLHQVSLSFLVDDMTRHWGGVAANISYSLALFGLQPKLMGTVGRDFEDLRGDAVDEIAVMRHEKQRAVEFDQRFLEDLFAVDVEMVGWFVEEERVVVLRRQKR